MTVWFWGWKPHPSYKKPKPPRKPRKVHVEPEEGEEFVPQPRVKQKPRRRSKDPRADRLSPSQRPGARFVSVSIPADAYVKLKEIATFRKLSMSKAFSSIVDPAFDKVYEESLLLMRIEETRKKEREKIETQLRANPTRRATF